MKENKKLDSEIDLLTIEKIKRDICFLYHQFAEYNYIMGDLDYSGLYNLPYWKFLTLDEVDLSDDFFVRDGCLVIILAMALDYIDGSGNYIVPYISLCRTELLKIVPFDNKTEKLVNTVKLALECAEQQQPETSEIGELSSWVYKEYVEGYFRKMVCEFKQQ